MLYIGIDLGTSNVKLLLTDECGTIHRMVSREYPLYFPKTGWAEQNATDWWDAVVDGMHELTQDIDRSRVAAIGCGGQMHGLVALDECDNVIRPVILWNDGRTDEQVTYLNEVIGKAALSQMTANIAFAGFTAPKLLWMRENEPELFAKKRTIAPNSAENIPAEPKPVPNAIAAKNQEIAESVKDLLTEDKF